MKIASRAETWQRADKNSLWAVWKLFLWLNLFLNHRKIVPINVCNGLLEVLPQFRRIEPTTTIPDDFHWLLSDPVLRSSQNWYWWWMCVISQLWISQSTIHCTMKIRHGARPSWRFSINQSCPLNYRIKLVGLELRIQHIINIMMFYSYSNCVVVRSDLRPSLSWIQNT